MVTSVEGDPTNSYDSNCSKLKAMLLAVPTYGPSKQALLLFPLLPWQSLLCLHWWRSAAAASAPARVCAARCSAISGGGPRHHSGCWTDRQREDHTDPAGSRSLFVSLEPIATSGSFESLMFLVSLSFASHSLSQYLVEAGWAEGGRLIGCTQPRRVAVQVGWCLSKHRWLSV